MVDDGSADGTYLEAKKAGVFVIKNRDNLGFNISLEKALYEVTTKYAFLTGPDTNFERDSLLDFLSFGIKGNFSLLFAQKNERNPFSAVKFNISRFLKKRYGVDISESSLSILFIGNLLLEKLKSETISNNESIILELVRIAIKSNLKLGTYKLETGSGLHFTRHSISLLIGLVHRKLERRKYLNKAFPRLYKESVKNGIIVAVFGYLTIRLIEIIIAYVTRLTR